jgi:hypothetical protein
MEIQNYFLKSSFLTKKWIAVISQISESIWLDDRSTRFYECRYIQHKVTCHNGTQGINGMMDNN